MYKVLVQNAKIPVIGNGKRYLRYNINHIMECQHPSLQKEFDALVEKGVIELVVEQKEPIEKRCMNGIKIKNLIALFEISKNTYSCQQKTKIEREKKNVVLNEILQTVAVLLGSNLRKNFA